MDAPEGSPLPRTGELSRRLLVSVHVLRARESRCGLLQRMRWLYPEAHALRVPPAAGLWTRVAKQAFKGSVGNVPDRLDARAGRAAQPRLQPAARDRPAGAVQHWRACHRH
jgi:hypothetical protein